MVAARNLHHGTCGDVSGVPFLVANLVHDTAVVRKRRLPRLGLVLGSGAARGWAHVGVVRALERAGIRPDLVCGTSVGALVGAAYASGEFERFCTGTGGMRRSDVLSFTDVGFSGGLLKGQRFMAFVSRGLEDRPIEELKIPFVAFDLRRATGEGELPRGWKAIVPPVNGTTWKFNVARANRDTASGPDDYSVWSFNGHYAYGPGKDKMHFHDQNNFGTLTFVR